MPNDTTQPQKPAKKSRRPSLVTIALVLLMLAGLGVLLYPTISDQFARWQAVQEIAQYNQVAEAEQARPTTAAWLRPAPLPAPS